MRMLGTADIDLLEMMMEPLSEAPFFVKDAKLRYVAANSSMARMCGLPHRRALIGRRAGDVFPEALTRRYERMDNEVLSLERPIRDRLELSGRKADTWLLYSRAPIFTREGEVVGVVGTARAIPAHESQSPAWGRMAQALEWLRTHFDQPLDSRTLASRVDISLSQLERDAQRILGVSLRKFHHRLRLDHAMALLRSDRSIAAVAQECGYADQSAFTRRFREEMGLPPTQWRSALSMPAKNGG